MRKPEYVEDAWKEYEATGVAYQDTVPQVFFNGWRAALLRATVSNRSIPRNGENSKWIMKT